MYIYYLKSNNSCQKKKKALMLLCNKQVCLSGNQPISCLLVVFMPVLFLPCHSHRILELDGN